jgi:diacylglycerol kinase family enzyme
MTIPWLAVVNPSAGRRRSPRWRRAIADQIARELGAEVVFTERRGHAEALSAEARVFAGVAVLGGDGTTAEVVNGMDLDRQVLLLLAGGTGNSLARDLHLTSLKAAFAAAHGGRRRTLDLLRVTFCIQKEIHTRLAISTTSVGYAAEVVGLTRHFYKSLGPLCYPVAATLQAARQRSFPLSVSVDGGPAREQRLSNVMVNNTCHAANFRAFRRADLSDGQMDVLLARAGCASQLLHNLAVLSRTYLYATAAEFGARQLSLKLPTPKRLMIDGELWEGVTGVQFEVLAGKLKCVA